MFRPGDYTKLTALIPDKCEEEEGKQRTEKTTNEMQEENKIDEENKRNIERTVRNIQKSSETGKS